MMWMEKRLGDVLTLKRGYDLTEAQRKEGEIPVVSSSGVTGSHNVAMVAGPGVVTGRYGTMGEVFYIESDFWPHNTALYVRDFKGSDPRFVSYFLKQVLRGAHSSKAAIPGVNRNDLHERKVFVPDADTQKRIVERLLPLDDLIENNRRRIQLLEQSARLLYREWFVHLRFPGHEHVRVVNGVPEGWQQRTLEDVCESVEDGDWIESKDQGGDDYRLLQVSNIGTDSFVETGNFRYVTEETFRRLRCREVVPGDILISRMPEPIGRGWLVTEMSWRMITAVDVSIAKVNAQVVTTHYLLQHLNSQRNIELCKQHATGATRPRISRRSLCALPIVVPPLSLQEEFSGLVSENHALKTVLEKQNKALAAARDLLLPRLMSGESTV